MNGNITVVLQVKDSTDYIDSIVVYALPDTATIIASKDSACDNDSIRLSLASSYPGYNIQWYKNDTVFISGATDSIFYAKESASYSVDLTNSTTFCVSRSHSKKVAIGQAAPGAVSAIFDGASNQFFLNPFPGGFMARWFKDGLEISGQTGRFLPFLGAGTYYAVVYNPDFPAV